MIFNSKYTEGLTLAESVRLKNYIQKLQKVNPVADIAYCPQTPITARYNLNRIRHNDPSMTMFRVNLLTEDPGLSGNEIARELAQTLKDNTHLMRLEISYTPLTDEAVLPLFEVLKKRPMASLDFSSTDITDRTIAPLLERFADRAAPQWKRLVLKHVIAGYQGNECADIAALTIMEKQTGQSLVFEPETGSARDQRMMRLIMRQSPMGRCPYHGDRSRG